MNPLVIVAAILLPPLGVFLDRGITPVFWITVLLTFLGFVPGLVFALVIIFGSRTAVSGPPVKLNRSS